jgi:hypothetical protein
MQVSEQKDFVTHAVIGGAETIDFGISNSAEFFNILSSTLYKDQILAVVREVLCNAWDAHIEAGCTDKPVEVIITKDKFIIRDFGKGIHRDDMGLIYGTYGNSTKKNDGKQTGGFGLGCKAPFAYTDHFEVASCNDGVRTIYNLSKSSAQAQGKPGIVPIVSHPSQESGLTVTIPIASSRDQDRFEDLVFRIARNGDMNMTLNGSTIVKLGFDNAKANVLITRMSNLIDNQPSIMVRYGNVIYPVDKVNELKAKYEKIEAYLYKLGNQRNGSKYHIVFQAPPHSIAVQPSREGLSMQGHTIKTLVGMFGDFLTMIDKDFPLVCDEVAIKSVDEAIADKRVVTLLSQEKKLPWKANADGIYPVHIMDLPTLAHRFMANNYPGDVAFRKRDLKYRLTEMSKTGLLNRGLVQTFLRALEKVGQSRITWNMYDREDSDWLQKNVLGRLSNKLMKAGLPVDGLCVLDSNDTHAPQGTYGRSVEPIVPVREVCPKHLFNTLPYLRNIVVVTTSMTNLWARCQRHEVFERLGKDQGFIVYRTGMKLKVKEDALTFFKASGMEVVDMTFKQSWEIDPTKPTYIAPRKKAKIGIPKLSCVLTSHNNINTAQLQLDVVERIEKPEFVHLVSVRDDTDRGHLGYHWRNGASKIIVDLFGDKGAITNMTNTATKYYEQGAKKLDDYVYEKVGDYLKTIPTIAEYWAYKPDRVVKAVNMNSTNDLIELIYDSEVLRKEYKLVNNLTATDKMYLKLYEHIIYESRHNKVPDPIAEATKHLDSIPVHPDNVVLLSKFLNNKLLKVVNSTGLATLIRNQDPTTDIDAKNAIEILNIILNK